MLKTLLILVLVSIVLTSATTQNPGTEIPESAWRTIQEDYLEWIHPPRLAGPCAEWPVIKVEWIMPRGVSGKRPVVWLRADGKFAAILGLTDAQADWIGGTVFAQPSMVLRDVSIYRLCRVSAITPW
ncbi:MAG: hypothetical protein HZB51_22850 [Chloroflexi bacterium]|nr:hypothetical protein [Chloroflexota bacterium]